MSNFLGRSSSQQGGSPVPQASRTTRSAALLIDFDNVTLGVHSDLGRELKALINSEVFRGKIAVRRAYADWRRFPNYVVPLTEASIDLIFAPAYGSSKKNTTDLRMSADAIELAFTRPEIDTFILLTGDSDFSSTVMKLKEYGKYVIGVGMRESSSDLIIQNCDEYFSYHALTGLTRATAGEGMREDPWELVVRAAQKMAASGDAMRTDRLKQVMLSMDPGFNEKEIGYSKFSRFVAEADKKGLLKLNKLPDGQYEIAIDGREAGGAAVVEGREPRDGREGRERDGRRARGDRGRRREGAEQAPRRGTPAAAEEASTAATEAAAAPAAEEAPPAAPAEAPAAEAPQEEAPVMQRALALLQRAVRAITSRAGEAVRDGDVKRKMLEFEPEFDEGALGFSKFSRFLRHAHDHEAIDLERLDGGQYEVKLGSRRITAPEPAAPAPFAPEAAPAARPPAAPLRGRGRGRTGAAESAGPPPLLPGQVVRAAAVGGTIPAAREETEAPPAVREEETAAPPERQPEASGAATGPQVAEVPAEATAEAPVEEGARTESGAAAAPPRRRARRGRRGLDTEQGPPPLLPGQVVGARTPAPAEPAAPAAAAAAVPEAPTEEGAESAEGARKRRRGGRGRKRKAEAAAEVASPAETEPTTGAEETAPAAPTAFSAEELNLPLERGKIENYLTKSYKGVGKKTVEPLLDAFGEDIFRVFAEQPERVREVLGDKRAATVLDQWGADYERRSADAAGAAGADTGSAADREGDEPAGAVGAAGDEAGAEAGDPAEATARARRRGGRGRKRKPEQNGDEAAAEPTAEAQAGADAADGNGSSAPEEQPAKRSRTRTRGGRSRGGRPPNKQPSTT